MTNSSKKTIRRFPLVQCGGWTLKVRLQEFGVYIGWDGISVPKGVISSVVRFLSFTGFFVLFLHLQTFFYNFLRTRDLTRDAVARLSFFLNFYFPFFFRLLISSEIRHDFFLVKQGHNSEPPLSILVARVSFVLFSQAGVSQGNWDEVRREDGWMVARTMG